MDAMQGYLDHETAHVIFTDFTALDKIARRDKKMFTVVNALEDPRIERKMADVWRGSAINLRHSREWSLKKMHEERDQEDPAKPGKMIKVRPWDNLSDFGKVLIGATVYTSVNFDETHWFMATAVEPDVLAKVKQCEDILREALSADNTTSVVTLAKKFMERMKEEEEPIEDIEEEDIPDNAIIIPPGQGMSAQEQTLLKKQPRDPNAPPVVQLEYKDDEDGDEEGDPNKPGRTVDGPGAAGSGTTTQNFQQRNYDPSAEELENDAKISSTGEMIKEAASLEFKGRDSYLVNTTEGDKMEVISDGDRVAYKEFMLEARSMVSVMKRKMSRSLLSSNVSRWEGDKTRGKINPRAIFRVSLGTSKRVFRQKVESEDFDTAIQIMVDHSGSMSGPKLDIAAKTSIIIGEIANQLGIPFSVMGFSTDDSHTASVRRNAASQEERNTYSRWGNQWIGVYKEFDELWMQNSHKLINMVHNQRHNTYDGESLRFAAQRLLGRKEKRKILFWLNDGEPCPNSHDNMEAHVEYAKLCAQEVEKRVELLAVGIQTDAVKNFYSNYIVVNDVNDLPTLCLGQLDDLLRKGKRLVPNSQKKKVA
jgi:cobalamin biosynthesis protein CobT